MKKPKVGDVVVILDGAPHAEGGTQELINSLGVVERVDPASEGYDLKDNVYCSTERSYTLYYYPEQLEVIGQL